MMASVGKDAAARGAARGSKKATTGTVKLYYQSAYLDYEKGCDETMSRESPNQSPLQDYKR